MQDDEAGIALRNHKDGNEVFKMSFSGNYKMRSKIKLCNRHAKPRLN